MQTILKWQLELFILKAACPGDKRPEFAASDVLRAEALHSCLFTLTHTIPLRGQYFKLGRFLRRAFWLEQLSKALCEVSLRSRKVASMISPQIKSMANELPMPASNNTPSPAKRRKLSGRAFYQSLGSPKMVLAPMVDQSEFVR